jgi:orotate phosphoribosyltransferase-like protein
VSALRAYRSGDNEGKEIALYAGGKFKASSTSVVRAVTCVSIAKVTEIKTTIIIHAITTTGTTGTTRVVQSLVRRTLEVLPSTLRVNAIIVTHKDI